MAMRLFLACAPAVLLICMPNRGNTEDNITADQVAREWDAREKLVKTARLKWTVVETRPKEHAWLLSGRTPKEGPDNDIVLKATRSLMIDGKLVRLEHDGQMWSTKTRTLEPLVTVSTFDGQRFGYSILKCSVVDHPETTIKSGDASAELRACDVLPVWYSLRGSLLATQDFSVNTFTPTGHRLNVNGRPCLEFVRVSKSSGTKEQLFIDAERALQVVRSVDSEKGRIKIQIDTTYQPDPALGWVPRSWEYVWRAPNGDLVRSVRCAVTEWVLNPEVTASEFAPVQPPGTRVVDLTSGSEVQYGIMPDGTKGREIRPSGQPIDYNDLMANRGLRIRTWKLWLIIGLTAILLVAVLMWLRRGRRSWPTPLPSS